MQPHFQPPSNDPLRPIFPSLPIVTPEEVRRSTREKYGGLFYLGIIGLATVIGLVAWFAHGAWSLRDVWSNVYVLHDSRRPDEARIEAAYALSRDPRVTERQLWDIALLKTLPPLARYVIAEALTADAVTDARAYGLSVAKSEGWPDWLRLLLVRPLAYAAAQGRAVPRDSLEELRRNRDPAIALWATFALAASDDPNGAAAAALERSATTASEDRSLARLLSAALQASGKPRLDRLDEATLWLRSHHPEAARIWKGWRVEGTRLVPDPAAKLP
jgi:hypothetical protein